MYKEIEQYSSVRYLLLPQTIRKRYKAIDTREIKDSDLKIHEMDLI